MPACAAPAARPGHQSTTDTVGAPFQHEPSPRGVGLVDASAVQPSLLDTRIRREARADSPFVVRCRDVKVGNPGAKHVYMTVATWCDVYVTGDCGVCWPALEKIRAATEYGRTAFMEHWRYLIERGLLLTTRGSGKKIVRTPDGALRREVPESDTSRSAGIRHITVPVEEDTTTTAREGWVATRPEPTARQLAYAADLGIETDGVDGVELGNRIEQAAAARDDGRAERRVERRAERRSDRPRRTAVEARRLAEAAARPSLGPIRNCPNCRTLDRGADCHCESCGWSEPGCPHTTSS